MMAIETPRLHLRRLSDQDVDDLVAACNNINVARYTALLPHPFTAKDAKELINGAKIDHSANSRHVFALQTRIGEHFAGCIEVNMGDDADTFGYWIAEPFWGQGYATEAALALSRFAFKTADKLELCAAVHPENKASMRVLEKSGFVYDRIETGLSGRCKDVEAKVFVLKAADWFKREAAKPNVLVVAVALVDGQGRVLIAQRPTGKPLAGLWEFPGGKVHENETPEQALVRELDEELGIEVKETCIKPFAFASHAYEDFHLIMPLYECRTWLGKIKPQEGQDFKWMRPDQLHTLPMPPADIPLVAKIEKRL